jgi:hypothetical protein
MKKFFLAFAAMALFAIASVTTTDARAGPGLHGTDVMTFSNDDTIYGGALATAGGDLNPSGIYGQEAGGLACTGTAGADSHDLTATLLTGEPAGANRTARREVASPPVGSVG